VSAWSSCSESSYGFAACRTEFSTTGGCRLLRWRPSVAAPSRGGILRGQRLRGWFLGNPERRQIVELLNDGEVRRVSLVGPPGAGKTRLAKVVADNVRGPYGDGAVCLLTGPRFTIRCSCRLPSLGCLGPRGR
jgi:hypothetical protein